MQEKRLERMIRKILRALGGFYLKAICKREHLGISPEGYTLSPHGVLGILLNIFYFVCICYLFSLARQL